MFCKSFFPLSDMGGIIPEDEEEYDDCLTMSQSEVAILPDDDIYEELPGLCLHFIFVHWITVVCSVANLEKTNLKGVDSTDLKIVFKHLKAAFNPAKLH